jgi:hypothetical protein
VSDETSEVAPPEEKQDRHAMLAAALDAAEQTQAAADDAPAEQAAPEVERPRGPDGKFLPAAAAPVDESPVATEPVEEPVWKRPPNSWKKDKHELWLTAASKPETAALVEYAYQREEEMKRGIEDIIPKAKFADQVNEALEPYRENQRAAGVEPVQALQALMHADHILRNAPPEQKKAYALNLLAQYGIQFNPEDAYAIPTYTPPPVDVAAVVQHELSAWEQRQQDQVLQAEIDEFKTTHPDFEEHRPAMQALLANSLAPDLETAYQKAKRLDDDAFKSMQEGLQAQAETDRRAAADKAAKNARAAAVSPRSSTPGARPATNAKDRRSMLAEQFDSLTERF